MFFDDLNDFELENEAEILINPSKRASALISANKLNKKLKLELKPKVLKSIPGSADEARTDEENEFIIS